MPIKTVDDLVIPPMPRRSRKFLLAYEGAPDATALSIINMGD